jgi:hypothetical protein
MSSDSYIRFMYELVLEREPDAGGFAYWKSMLDDTYFDQLGVFSQFYYSAEFALNHPLLAPEAGSPAASYPVTPASQAVAEAYHMILQRSPDHGGLVGWTNQVNAGMSRHDLVLNFYRSNEAQQLHRPFDMDNTQFTTFCYHLFLQREPDAGGLANWSGALNNGSLNRDQMIDQFLASGEFVSKHPNLASP